jgi:hypothetical protein
MSNEFYFVFVCFVAGAILLIGPFVLIGIIAGVLSIIERIKK